MTYSPYDLAQTFMQPYRLRGRQAIPKYCPFCNGGEHRDKDTFAMDVDSGAYNCQRGGCGVKGGFGELARHFGIDPEIERTNTPTRKRRVYKKPAANTRPITSEAESYLAKRKISRSTMDYYGVGCDESGNIMFPFTRGGELVYVKYRPARKVARGERKAWCEADAEPILFGMDSICEDDRLVITEGEIDAMSAHEAGGWNAVSVPSGCNNTDWIDSCWDWMKQFKRIILCGDMDDPGREMTRALSKRLSAWPVFIVDLPNGRKDANEVLFFDGPKVLNDAISAAVEANTPGILRLSDVRMENALTVESIASGIGHLDEQTGGFLMGELSVWTGKRGSGKSTLIGQCLLDSVEQGYPVCAYSGELRAARFQNWIDLQAAGPNHIENHFSQRRGRDVPIVPLLTRKQIHEWYRDMFFLYDNGIIGTAEEAGILDVFRLAAQRYGCRVFLVDNLMTSRYEQRSDRDHYAAQGRFVGELAAFAKEMNVHVHLVAHPRKADKSDKSGNLDGDDIAGSGEILDRADNGFSVRRVPEGLTELRVLKNREDGLINGPPIGLQFCPLSRRLYQPSDGIREYGWTVPEWARGMEYVQEVANL